MFDSLLLNSDGRVATSTLAEDMFVPEGGQIATVPPLSLTQNVPGSMAPFDKTWVIAVPLTMIISRRSIIGCCIGAGEGLAAQYPQRYDQGCV